jgi:hypothetical protein
LAAKNPMVRTQLPGEQPCRWNKMNYGCDRTGHRPTKRIN